MESYILHHISHKNSNSPIRKYRGTSLKIYQFSVKKKLRIAEMLCISGRNPDCRYCFFKDKSCEKPKLPCMPPEFEKLKQNLRG